MKLPALYCIIYYGSLGMDEHDNQQAWLNQYDCWTMIVYLFRKFISVLQMSSHVVAIHNLINCFAFGCESVESDAKFLFYRSTCQ